MKSAKVFFNGANSPIEITAPSDKNMVFDPAVLQHGILAIGEYGPSGIKIAAFREWNYATFGAEAEGYTITNSAK
jgi:hypothetical protein